MELDWLDTFLAVVDRGGFTAASEHLHRSQSRVSAHIAALERDLGVRLIDRTRRPATLTTAGEVFAQHARNIVADVGTARSAVGTLRGLDQGSLAVLTTPCVGTALFPAVLARLADEHPGLRILLVEQTGYDVERKGLADDVALAVLPLVPTFPRGLRQQTLWCEPVQVLVRSDHELAQDGRPVRLGRLASQSLVVTGTSADAEPEVLKMLSARGFAGRPRATVDTPQTLVSLVRAGVGVGVLNAVAAQAQDTTGLTVLDIDDDELVRDVAAFWYDVLLDTQLGRRLHRAVVEAPIPAGAVARPAGRREPPIGLVRR